MDWCCCPPPRGMREVAALPSEEPHEEAGYWCKIATMTSPSSSLSLFFENELGWGVGGDADL